MSEQFRTPDGLRSLFAELIFPDGFFLQGFDGSKTALDGKLFSFH
jgi:hypothetical protein